MHDYSFERKIMQASGRTQDVVAQHAAPAFELDASLTPVADGICDSIGGIPMRFALLTLIVATPALAQEPAGVSERAAFRWSLWATAIPVAAGTVLWIRQASDAWSSEGPDRTGAALLVAGGLTIGPSFGYRAAGLGGRGASGVALRAGLTLLSFLPAFRICGWDCEKGDAAYEAAWLAVATGTGLSLVSAIYDISRVRHDVRRQRAHSDKTCHLRRFTYRVGTSSAYDLP